MKKYLILALVALSLFGCKKVKEEKTTNENLTLVKPQQLWCNYFQTFFHEDEFVEVDAWDGEVMNVRVSDLDKYCALFKTFNGGDWHYGKNKIKINFEYTGNEPQPNTIYDTDVKDLFKGNKYYITDFKDEGGFQFHHVILTNETITTYIDNLGSHNGCVCHSAEDQALIVFFGTELGVQFSSDKRGE